MLSRIVESLFWIGRYLERADDTARLLDVQIHRILEDALVVEDRACSNVLSVMGIRPEIDAEPALGAIIDLLGYSTEQPSSIVSSLRSARENAAGIRESISSELWECLNATTITADARVVARARVGPHDFFGFAMFVKERVAVAAGIADSTMSRDDGWRFLALGRAIQRVDMTARLLEVQVSNADDIADWTITLRSCSAYEAYLRARRGILTPASVIEFLVLDRNFPRSIYFSLGQAQSCIAELEQPVGQSGSANDAARLIGLACATLEYRTVRELIDNLPEHLMELQQSCFQATALIAEHYFQQGATLAWRAGSTLNSAMGSSS